VRQVYFLAASRGIARNLHLAYLSISQGGLKEISQHGQYHGATARYASIVAVLALISGTLFERKVTTIFQ
jgi:hypothetical protein